MTPAGEKRSDVADDRNGAGRASRRIIADNRATDHRPAVVVHVEETISPALAGHEGVVHESPPLPRIEALALVRLLIGRDCQPAEQDSWRCPIAGGQRTIRLQPAARAGISANGLQWAIGGRP